MQDQPAPDEILAAISAFLRDEVMPAAEAHTAFQVRVAANAIDLARRQLEFGSAGEKAELARLQILLGGRGSLDDLNTSLADALASGAMGLATPGVSEHLRATTLEKLRVDQPSYSGCRAALDRSAGSEEA
jgi:hypothetical protein